MSHVNRASCRAGLAAADAIQGLLRDTNGRVIALRGARRCAAGLASRPTSTSASSDASVAHRPSRIATDRMTNTAQHASLRTCLRSYERASRDPAGTYISTRAPGRWATAWRSPHIRPITSARFGTHSRIWTPCSESDFDRGRRHFFALTGQTPLCSDHAARIVDQVVGDSVPLRSRHAFASCPIESAVRPRRCRDSAVRGPEDGCEDRLRSDRPVRPFRTRRGDDRRAAVRAAQARESRLDLASCAHSSHRAGPRAARPLRRFASTAPEAGDASDLA